MKKILFLLSVFLTTLISAQNHNDYGSYYHQGNEDEFYFPDDYYYQYPVDYYNRDLYKNYYDDYRRSIYDVNWNRFFAKYRLAPWQVQQIMILNDSFPSFAAWNSFYRYNPDRWYYDRFYALQRILGPQVFLVFQNNYYQGYHPVFYYENYKRRHYARSVYVIPRYQKVNINAYRVNRTQYHQSNPRADIGFQQTSRTGLPRNSNANRDNGFTDQNNARNNSIRPENGSLSNQVIKNENSRNNGTRNDFRNPTVDGGFRNSEPRRKENLENTAHSVRTERNPGNRSNQNQESRTPNSGSRNSGQRFTAR